MPLRWISGPTYVRSEIKETKKLSIRHTFFEYVCEFQT